MVIELARCNRPDMGRGANLIAAALLLLDVVDATEPCLALLGTDDVGGSRSDWWFMLGRHAELASEV